MQNRIYLFTWQNISWIQWTFSDILSLLSLAELGVGTAILYSMYKPAAQGEHKKVAALLNLYKKVYNSIGVVITVVGLCLTPFLKYLISDVPDMREVPVYSVFVEHNSELFLCI